MNIHQQKKEVQEKIIKIKKQNELLCLAITVLDDESEKIKAKNK